MLQEVIFKHSMNVLDYLHSKPQLFQIFFSPTNPQIEEGMDLKRCEVQHQEGEKTQSFGVQGSGERDKLQYIPVKS